MAALLNQRLKVAHLSSGDLLREALRRGDPIGQEASRYMKEGALVPDELVTKLMVQRVEELGAKRPFVLDGFPRTVDQTRALDEELAFRSHAPVDLAVDFEISAQKTVVTRLAGRRVCASCGSTYHLMRLPPRNPGVCDRCGATLVARADDQPETILKRLNVYREQTEPLLFFYRAQGKLRSLSGEMGVEEQYQSLIQLLEREHLCSNERVL